LGTVETSFGNKPRMFAKIIGCEEIEPHIFSKNSIHCKDINMKSIVSILMKQLDIDMQRLESE
jgi:hypothetical protein